MQPNNQPNHQPHKKMSELLQIENKAGKVKLTDAVTHESIGSMIDQIAKLFGASASAQGQDFGAIMNYADNAVDTLEIEINSPGGSIFDGYNIYREIKSLQDRGVVVTATITGMAASMASVIAMACDEIQMVPHGRMMIHEASQGVRGNADELRKAADLLDGISNDIAAIYSERTGKPIEDVRTMMKEETWMTATEALAIGFIDSVVDIRQNNPTKKPMSILNRLTSPSSEEATAQITALETQITGHDSEIQGFKDKLEIAETALQEAAGFKVEIEAFTAEVSLLKDERDTLSAELVTAKAEIIAATESAGQIATETLASIGQTEPLAEVTEDAPTDLLSQYEALQGSEKREFLSKNAVAIQALAKAAK